MKHPALITDSHDVHCVDRSIATQTLFAPPRLLIEHIRFAIRRWQFSRSRITLAGRRHYRDQ